MKNTFVSKLTATDFDLYSNFFDQQPRSYADSWAYILRETNLLLVPNVWKYCTGETLITVYESNSAIHLVRPVGINIIDSLCSLVESIRTTDERKIVVRKLSVDTFDNLVCAGLLTPRIMGDALFEDDAFPELEIDISVICQTNFPNGGRFKNLRQQIHFLMKRLDIKDIEWQELSQVNIELALSVILGWTQKRKLNPNTYGDLLSYASQVNKGSVKGFLAIYKGEPLGVYIIDKLDCETIGLYCGVTTQNYLGLTDTLDWLLYQRLQIEGVKYVAIGGSENIGVWHYVQKYRPTEPRIPSLCGLWKD